MYRLVVESLLGLQLQGDRLRVTPRLPRAWNEFEIHYRYRETQYHLHVRRRNGSGGGAQGTRVVCDGVEQADGTVPLRDDRKEHQVEIEVGAGV